MDEEIRLLLEKGPVRVLLTNGTYADIIDSIGGWWKYQYPHKKAVRTGLVKTPDISAIQPKFDSMNI